MEGRGFNEGSTVLVTLHSPRQKFFGVLLKLAIAGVELCAVPLESMDDLARQIRAGEQAGGSTVFFPMHRIERMELDAAMGELPSLGASFAAKAGRAVEEIFGEDGCKGEEGD
jgi:hypothetical protein